MLVGCWKWRGPYTVNTALMILFWEMSPKTTDVNIIAASHPADSSEPLIWENSDIIKKSVALGIINTLHNNHYKSFTWPLCNKPLLRPSGLKDHLQERLGRSLGSTSSQEIINFFLLSEAKWGMGVESCRKVAWTLQTEKKISLNELATFFWLADWIDAFIHSCQPILPKTFLWSASVMAQTVSSILIWFASAFCQFSRKVAPNWGAKLELSQPTLSKMSHSILSSLSLFFTRVSIESWAESMIAENFHNEAKKKKKLWNGS